MSDSFQKIKGLIAKADPKVRARGGVLYKDGHVHLSRLSDGQSGGEFRVESASGPTSYRVRLDLSGESALYSCTCPYMYDHATPCKHIVAASLKMQKLIEVTGYQGIDNTSAVRAAKRKPDESQTVHPDASAGSFRQHGRSWLDEAGRTFHAFERLSEEEIKAECAKTVFAKARTTASHAATRDLTSWMQTTRFDQPFLEPSRVVLKYAEGYGGSETNRVEIWPLEGGLALRSSGRPPGKSAAPLDRHKATVLLFLLFKFGANVLGNYRERFAEGLKAYGLSMDDAGWQRYLTPVLTAEGVNFAGKVNLVRPDERPLTARFRADALLPPNRPRANGKSPETAKDIPVLLLARAAEGEPFSVNMGLSALQKNGYYQKPEFIGQVNALLECLPATHYELLRWLAEQFSDPWAAVKLLREAVRLGVAVLRETEASVNRNLAYKSFESRPVAVAATPYSTGGEVGEEGPFFVMRPYVEAAGERLFGAVDTVAEAVLLHERTLYLPTDRRGATILAELDYEPEDRQLYAVKTAGFASFFNAFGPEWSAFGQLDDRTGRAVSERPIAPKSLRVYLRDLEDGSLGFFPMLAYEDGEEELELPLAKASQAVWQALDDETLLKSARDLGWEEEQSALLASLHPSFENAPEGFFTLSVSEALEGGWFLGMHERLSAAGAEVLGQEKLANFRMNLNRPSLQMRASSGIDWLDIHAEITFGEQKADLRQVREALLAGRRYVSLKDGTTGMLPAEWLERYAALFRNGQASKDSLKVSALHVELLDELADELHNAELAAELRRKKERLRDFESVGRVEPPAELQAELRPYQHSGLNWLAFLDEFGWGGCLADDMGLGKTLQTLAFLAWLQERNPNGRHLAVLPASLVFNWAAEAERFAPELKVRVHHGAERDKSPEGLQSAELTLTTYATLRVDLELFSEAQWDYVILDEAQAIKNPGAQASKAVKALKARNRLALTGTPVENSPSDLFSLFDFLNPGLLGNADSFRKLYAKPLAEGDEARSAELRRTVKPFLLRRTKGQVAQDLPEKTESVIWCEMTGPQRRAYDAAKAKARNEALSLLAEKGRGNAGFAILTALTRLRQICSMPSLLTGKHAKAMKESAKLQEVRDRLLEIAPHRKALVFGQFLETLQALQSELERQGVQTLYLDGSTQNRGELVRRFQEESEPRVFLLSLKAGGTGLNLTAAEYVFLLDPWWNPAVERQAVDRTHRIGQRSEVFAYRLVCRDTLEEKILKLQEKKAALADELVQAEGGFMKALSDQDLVGLFD